LKLGLSFDMRNPKAWRRPWGEVWDDNLWLACEAEQLGFDHIWMQEHFFTEDGYAPSIPIFLATLIERTSSARIGSHIYVLPLHHPAQLAQETAVLDHLSGGRLDVGVGLGHRVAEYLAYGYSPKQRPSRMEEGVEVLRRAWTQRPFSFEGRFWNIEDVEVHPEPLQDPHPPLWLASTAVKSAERAGRLGANLACASGEPEVYEAYVDALRARGEDPADYEIAGGFAITATLEDPEVVWERNRRYYFEKWDFYTRVRQEVGDAPLTNAAASDGDPSEDPYRAFELIGDPVTILMKLDEIRSSLPLTQLITFPPPAGIPFREEGIESLRLFATEVLPVIKEW
jgi:alkanesulfonate monooxygenase SsuD/methylene tetrahydromethanopterin reductase-like flavin-dependent oxidoreductase (luciferase family)